jgi:GxxExxY protein
MLNQLTQKIIGSAIEVHKHLGPGLLESAYEECVAKEFEINSIKFERQKTLPIVYKDIKLDCGYRIDFLVEDHIVVELKSVEQIIPIFIAQLLTYLRLMEKHVGLLINFNVPILRNGIRRVVNNYQEE